MLKLKTSDATKEGSDGGASGYDFDGYRDGSGGGSAVAWRRRDLRGTLTGPAPFICFYHFCFVLFRLVVYRWTAVNDKRLRGHYLKWGSAIPLVRGYETQKRQASEAAEGRAKARGGGGV